MHRRAAADGGARGVGHALGRAAAAARCGRRPPGTATSRALRFCGHQQRLGARVEHAVAALELRAVDREVGLVDQLVGVGAVARETDAMPIETVARIGSLEVSTSYAPLGGRLADPLGDLERLLGRRLRQENRELLAAEPRRDVVVPQLEPEHLGDAL